MSISPDLVLSENFRVRDLTPTSTGIPNLPSENELDSLYDMASVLDELKARLGGFTIASGYRTPAVNAAVGGSSTSRHMTGQAVDIVPHTKSAEQYWVEILANPDLKNKLGEISYKIYQNSIHLTLPFINSYGGRTLASPRVANNDTGSVIYRSISSNEVSDYFAKYGIDIKPAQVVYEKAKDTVVNAVTSPLGLGVIFLGGGLFIFSLALRKKRRKND